ncbi:MAG: DUF1853 family protein [Pseudomonadota bacterium]
MSAFVYHNQAVRDLAWSCFSASLISGEALAAEGHPLQNCEPVLTPERKEWLLRLDRRPNRLLAYLSERPAQRLGIYFERLWQFFLREDPQFELVAHNLPVRDASATLGEFDIIYWCHRRCSHVHLELAVKFYLGHSPGNSAQRSSSRESQWRQWLGPNAKDRLDIKLNRLQQHQSALTRLPQAQAQLAALGVGNIIPEVAIKGYLFTPLSPAMDNPVGYNARGQMQRWFSIEQLNASSAELQGDYFLTLPKARWLSPICAASFRECVMRSNLTSSLQSILAGAKGRPQLTAALDAQGNEQYRFFTTPEHWPYNQPGKLPKETI